MKRSLFLLIAALLAAVFGGMMLFTPAKAAEGFGMTSNPENSILFRTLGSMVLCAGILNFLVRAHSDTATLKAILLVNVIMQTVGAGIDLLGVYEEVLQFGKVVPGIVVHLFIGIGSLMYYLKIKTI